MTQARRSNNHIGMAPKRKAPAEGKAGHTAKKPATVEDESAIAESAFASRYLSTPIPKDKYDVALAFLVSLHSSVILH